MTATIARNLRTAFILFVGFSVLCGLVYPLAMTGIAEGVFPHKANGSLIERDGAVVGSELIGQQFTGPEYFHGRPSAAGDGYDAAASSGSNLGPTSAALVERVESDAAAVRAENDLADDAPIPVDAVTASASGLDPHISPAYAHLQIPRVAAERDMSQEDVQRLVEENTGNGLLGEPRVNVLGLNLALDEADGGQ
jgi:K+-transporting ATPase ATPase C chain